jgi:hypothetical protein
VAIGVTQPGYRQTSKPAKGPMNSTPRTSYLFDLTHCLLKTHSGRSQQHDSTRKQEREPQVPRDHGSSNRQRYWNEAHHGKHEHTHHPSAYLNVNPLLELGHEIDVY